MLSIGKVGGGQGDPRYYLNSVAKGREDYYTGHGEAQGRWLGVGAAGRSLTGAVQEDEFLGLLTTGVDGSGKTVLAYDLTFSAPKSVSVLYGITDTEMSRRVRDAHDAAVHQALGYVEREACWTRRGKAGRQRIKGNGLSVAAFRHRSSRAGDPQLHTHAVVANLTKAEGRSTALDGRALYAHQRTAGFLYQAALRAELTRSIGVEWGPVTNGVAEIAGIDKPVLEHFSRRSAEIRERMREHGGRSARSAEIAALETRRTKTYDVPAQRLHDEWRSRAAEMGLDTDALASVLDRRAAGPPVRPDIVAEARAMSSPGGITREASSFDRRDALRDWAEAHREGADVERLEALADRWLASGHVTALEHEGPRHRAGGRRYSTPDMLRVERDLIATAEARQRCGAGCVPEESIDELLAERPELAPEQRELVRRLTQSGDGIQVVRAAAGTGKTFALSTARDAWEADGHRVFGCALAARAAVELESQAGIDSCTIARLRGDLERGHGLPEDSVLVVDEAGMVGTRAIAELATHAAETHSKLVLVGDDRQLPELDAGGAFRGLADRIGAVELKEKRRQVEAWDRNALSELRFGRVDRWADAYRDHGRIVAEPTADKLHHTLVRDWWDAARKPDSDAVMIAHRRADVALLNQLARERMRHDNRLAGEELRAGDRAFAVGDRVLARRNDRELEIVNGMRATVVDTDVDGKRLRIELEDGTSREIDSTYLDDGHLDHGYAVTAHAAQGATVDRAFVLGSDALYREWAYTAMTRHRVEARFYVVSRGTTERALPGLEPPEDPLSRDLRDVLHASRRKELATTVAERGVGTIELPEPAAPAMPDGRDVLRRQTEDAREHAQALREQAASTSRWRRREREELLALAQTHERTAQHWEDELAQPAPAVPLLLGRDTDDSGHLDGASLRGLMVDPPATLIDRIGERPESLFERETWDAAAAQLATHGDLILEPLVAPEAPPLDTGLDL